MNRLQAGDLKSYLSMQTVSMPFPETTLIPRTDQHELAQLQALGETQGLGYELNDDSEFRDTLGEFGIDGGFNALSDES